MRRKLLAGLCLVVCLFVTASKVNAQVDEHRSEVGGLFTSITLTDFDSRLFPTQNFRGNSQVAGVGGRYGFNFNEHVALEAEVNFFPANHLLNEEFGQKMQGFAGVKAGIRKNKVGIFAKARPGVMWFGEFSSRGSCSVIPSGSVCTVAHEKDFAMDLGGVLEFYPTKRFMVRVDAGDTIIRYQERAFGTVVVPAATKNNFQMSIGIGWRF